MKPKLKYAPLAIATAIVNVIALIGTYMIYSPLNSLANASSSGDYASLANFSTDSLTNASLIFFIRHCRNSSHCDFITCILYL